MMLERRKNKGNSAMAHSIWFASFKPPQNGSIRVSYKGGWRLEMQLKWDFVGSFFSYESYNKMGKVHVALVLRALPP